VSPYTVAAGVGVGMAMATAMEMGAGAALDSVSACDKLSDSVSEKYSPASIPVTVGGRL
jgi:thiazole synthase ThiGH ThiG subunit